MTFSGKWVKKHNFGNKRKLDLENSFFFLNIAYKNEPYPGDHKYNPKKLL